MGFCRPPEKRLLVSTTLRDSISPHHVNCDRVMWSKRLTTRPSTPQSRIAFGRYKAFSEAHCGGSFHFQFVSSLPFGMGGPSDEETRPERQSAIWRRAACLAGTVKAQTPLEWPSLSPVKRTRFNWRDMAAMGAVKRRQLSRRTATAAAGVSQAYLSRQTELD